MDLLNYYSSIIESYPEYVTQKQLIEICNICQKTAYSWGRKGKFSFTQEIGSSVRYNRYRLLDVLQYLYERDCRQEPDSNYIIIMRKFYEDELCNYPDIIDVSSVISLTGFSKSAITNWVRRKKLKEIRAKKKFYIPKEYLIEFLISPNYRQIRRKTEKQLQMMKKFEKQYAVYLKEGVEKDVLRTRTERPFKSIS